MTPSETAAAMWGLAENQTYPTHDRLRFALQALEFFGGEYDRALEFTEPKIMFVGENMQNQQVVTIFAGSEEDAREWYERNPTLIYFYANVTIDPVEADDDS